MNDFEKDKLKAELLKQCDKELKKVKLIEDENERNQALITLHDKYQKSLLTLGVSSWKSLIDKLM